MKRRLVWLQLLIGWLPIWALFSTLVFSAHQGATVLGASLLAFHLILTAAPLGLLVHRLTTRIPWPRSFRLSFLGVHLLAAAAYAIAWLLLNSAIDSIIGAHLMLSVGPGLAQVLILGFWIYVMVAGVSYADAATERAARAEALAATSQLAALRAQLHPHFLFNALHTVVQLIPHEPRRAAQAAEQLAALLRTTIEDDRDLVTLGEEWTFVGRYLDLERIRFGDRLVVHVDMTDDARGALIPSFALQTLVENAVRHGAAPREEPTDVVVTARASDGVLTVRVHDTGSGASADQLAGQNGAGTGLVRLRERLAALYATRARLDIESGAERGFTATLVLPLDAGD